MKKEIWKLEGGGESDIGAVVKSLKRKPATGMKSVEAIGFW